MAVVPGRSFSKLTLGKAGVIAVDVVAVAAQRRVVAGIGKQDGPQPAVGRGDLQHGHVVVHGPALD